MRQPLWQILLVSSQVVNLHLQNVDVAIIGVKKVLGGHRFVIYYLLLIFLLFFRDATLLLFLCVVARS
jgi:hypothetical protein